MNKIKKIKLDNFSKEQLELIIKASKGDGEAKDALEFWAGHVYNQIIQDKKYNVWEYDALPMKKLEFVAKVEIPFTIVNKKFKKGVNKA